MFHCWRCFVFCWVVPSIALISVLLSVLQKGVIVRFLVMYGLVALFFAAIEFHRSRNL